MSPEDEHTEQNEMDGNEITHEQVMDVYRGSSDGVVLREHEERQMPKDPEEYAPR